MFQVNQRRCILFLTSVTLFLFSKSVFLRVYFSQLQHVFIFNRVFDEFVETSSLVYLYLEVLLG